MKKRISLLLSVIMLLTLVAGCGSAEDGKITIPDSLRGKTLTITSGWGAGSLAIMARSLQQIIKERHDIDIVVEIKEGAAGSVAMMDILNGPKDGARITCGGPNTFIFMNDGSLPTEISDYTFVSTTIRENRVCLVRPDYPITNVAEFIDLLKNGPDAPYRIGSTSAGGVGEAAPLSVIAALGLDSSRAVTVPFPSTDRSLAELLGGNVDFIMPKFSDVPGQLAAGEVRPLFSQSAEKLTDYPGMEFYPDLETFCDTEYWGDRLNFGDTRYLVQLMVGPAGMPPETVEFWAALLKDALESDTWQEHCRKAALITDPILSGPELVEFAHELREAYGAMVETYYR